MCQNYKRRPYDYDAGYWFSQKRFTIMAAMGAAVEGHAEAQVFFCGK
jgi:hypothetical protein